MLPKLLVLPTWESGKANKAKVQKLEGNNLWKRLQQYHQLMKYPSLEQLLLLLGQNLR
jgi:hypothetical protein